MNKQNRNGEGECYQVNSRVRAVYRDDEQKLTSLMIDGEDVNPDKQYTIALQGYHANNSQAYLNITREELYAIKTKVVSTSSFEVIEEFLKANQNISRRVEGRLEYQNTQHIDQKIEYLSTK
jgi:5'-nucleotidase